MLNFELDCFEKRSSTSNAHPKYIHHFSFVQRDEDERSRVGVDDQGRGKHENTMGSGCVAQLVERLPLIPEVRSLNPVIGKILFKLNICLLSTVY